MIKSILICLFCFVCSTLSASCSQGILFPFYIYPTTENIQPLIDAKKKYPGLPLRVILNPDSGVGTKKNPDYVSAVARLKKACISILGYVATDYAKRPLADTKKEINQWMRWYNPDGIFLDEMSTNHAYYRTLTAYAKGIGFHYTVGNPGENIGPESAKDVDTLNVFENSYLPDLADFKNWSSFPPGKISMLSYGIPALPSAFISKSSTVFGWIFITQDTLPNPWDTYPDYFSQLVDQLGN